MICYKKLKYFPFLLILITFDLNSLNGSFSVEHSATNKSWNFLPKFNNSFDNSKTSTLKAFLYGKKFGMQIESSKFNLDLQRPIEPKSLDLLANSNTLEFFYILNSANVFSISVKNQKADTQTIDCLQFSSLIIGSCVDANLSIRNTNEKYINLGKSLLMINGENNELKLNFYRGVNFNLFDEINLYTSVSKNSFDWLTPLEEIKSGLVYNITINNQKVGELIQNELIRLPQRDNWNIYKLGASVNKNFFINNLISLFYKLDLMFLYEDNYNEINRFPNKNVKIDSGINLNFENFVVTVSGSIYKNNILGFEDISFNQRSEHHFDKEFGTINLEFLYRF